MITAIAHPVVLFDGVCNLCQTSVQFMIQHNKAQNLRFASLQGEFGQQVLQQFNLSTSELNSLVFLDKGKIYTHSTGALKISCYLNYPWKLLYGFIIVPTFIRNAVYRWIANNRYRWFGKQATCWLPSPSLQQLFYP
jgi:predicted DCC family thiol-disulfide oxidoreductase YuxK